MADEKHYVLVTKNSCPHCQGALNLLKESDLKFSYTDMENCEEALEATKEQLNWKTVPMIWEQNVNWEENAKVVDNNFIGGFKELKEHLKK
jgi:glutaredoxin